MAFDVFNMKPPEDITQSIRDELQDYLQIQSDWNVELVGSDGKMSTNGLTLILFSPVLYSVLEDHWCKPYPTQVLLPDFSIKTICLFVNFMITGFVSANEDELLNLTVIIEALKLTTKSSQFTVMAMPEDNEIIIDSHNTVSVIPLITPKIEEDSYLDDELKSDDDTASIENEDEGSINAPSTSSLDISILKNTLLSDSSTNTANVSQDHDKQVDHLLKCSYCDRIFIFKRNLKKHTKSCSKKIPLTEMYNCDICTKQFTRRYYLHLHQRSHYHESLTCRVCGCTSETIIKKINHVCSVSSSKEIFTCEVCDKVYGEKCIKLVHMQQHSESKKLHCPICSRLLTSTLSLINHVRQHTKECVREDSLFTYSSQRKPTDERHITKESLTCKICSACFWSGIDKVEHDCKVKSDQRTFSCDICNKVYGEKCVMLVHKQQHSENSKTACPICQKCIPPMLHLLRHVRIHTNESDENTNSVARSDELIEVHPFSPKLRAMHLSSLQKAKFILSQKKNKLQCPFCNKICSCANNTALHMRFCHEYDLDQKVCTASTSTYDARNVSCSSVTEIPSHARTLEKTSINLKLKHDVISPKLRYVHWCKVCSKQFTEKILLLLHEQIHRGKPDYKCFICNRLLSTITNAARHVKLVHQTWYKEHLKLKKNIGNAIYSHKMKTALGEPSRMDEMSQSSSGFVHSNLQKSPRYYKCKLCNKKCISPVRLLLHGQIHKGKSQCQCPFCDKLLSNDGNAAKHVTLVHINTYCSICENLFTSETELLQHKHYKHKAKTYLRHSRRNSKHLKKCVEYEKVDSDSNVPVSNPSNVPTDSKKINSVYLQLRAKYKLKSKNVGRSHVCRICKKKFGLKVRLLLHYQWHRGHSDRQCPYCKEILCNVQAAVRHVRMLHTKESNSHDIQDHQKHRGTNEKKYGTKLSKSRNKRGKAAIQVPSNLKIPISDSTTPPRKRKRKSFPKDHKCSDCTSRFTSRARLLVHGQLHMGKSECECPICNKYFKVPLSTANHVKEHISHFCRYCSKEFKTRQLLLNHRVVHYKVNTKKNVSSNDLHEKYVGKEINYGQEFSLSLDKESEAAMKVHASVSSTDSKVPISDTTVIPMRNYKRNLLPQLHQCSDCKRRFRSRARLLVHKQIHKGKSEHECPICNKYFSGPFSTAHHVQQHISHYCTYCLKTFKTSQLLLEHRKIHNKPKKDKRKHRAAILQKLKDIKTSNLYKCSNCQRSFNSRARLLVHTQIHRGKSECECPICNKYFSAISSATLHVKQHISHYCTICGKEFKNHKLLVTHRSFHYKQKKYKETSEF